MSELLTRTVTSVMSYKPETFFTCREHLGVCEKGRGNHRFTFFENCSENCVATNLEIRGSMKETEEMFTKTRKTMIYHNIYKEIYNSMATRVF